MPKPIVAIIGRPNVGKSTLFNRITRSHTAIVEDFPGVTRDRIYQEASWDDRGFVVIDTGGLYPDSRDGMLQQTREQALFAIEEANVILLLFDGKEGLTEVDRSIVDILRPIGKKVFYIVNKVDAPTKEERLLDFYSLGLEDIIPLSAATGYNYQELMERLLQHLPEHPAKEAPTPALPRIAIVGKPNVGKSTIVNSLLGNERMIVSPEPGTTRDSVDSVCRYYGREYVIIDTAGLRKKAKVSYPLERFMALRAVRSIERADVVLLLIDAVEGVSEQDQKVAGLIHRYGKGAIVIFNKWDLITEPKKRHSELMNEFSYKLHFIRFAPVLTVSGITKKRLTRVFPVVDRIMEERRKRIPTPELNRFITEVTPMLPTYRGKKFRIFYITQTAVEPPSFTVFVNHPQVFKPEHIRFIERTLRERYSFEGTPIRISIRRKGGNQ